MFDISGKTKEANALMFGDEQDQEIADLSKRRIFADECLNGQAANLRVSNEKWRNGHINKEF